MKNLFNTLLIVTLCSSNATSIQMAPDKTWQVDVKSMKSGGETPKAGNELSFEKYCNSRYDYCIDYPKDIVFPQPESFNGDGRVFKDKEGQEILRVFGRNNSDPDFGNKTLEQQFNEDLRGSDAENGKKGRVITYKKLGKTFFVISGYSRGKIFYQKTILKENAFAYAILQYDEKDKATFDKVSERIFKSFK